MHSPPVELVLDVIHLGTRNLIRATGEADNDTISECLRDVVAKHPRGELLLGLALAGGSAWFWNHIVGPLR